MTAPEMWLQIWPVTAADVAEKALVAEAQGWHGIALADTQCISDDVYVLMALAANATTTLRVMTGVTNPYTRHPSVAAGGFATIQAAFDGRAVLGIGRGDSALGQIGLTQGSVASFGRYVQRLQGYLSGQEIPFDERDIREGASPIERIHAGAKPTSSRLVFLDPSVPKVPVDVHSGGLRTLGIGARLAERVTLLLGAERSRVQWGIDVVRRAAEEAERDPDTVELGTVVSVVPHPDLRVACRLGAGHQAAMMRESAMFGQIHGPMTDENRKVIEDIVRHYNMNAHASTHTAQSSVLTQKFVETYAVVGDAAHCVQRLQDLVGQGLSRLYVATPGIDAGRGATDSELEEIETVNHLITSEVLPKLVTG